LTAPARRPDVSGGRLVRLIAAKAITNVGSRWVPFFLPTLATAFSATTRQMTLALGLGEMAGLVTLAVGRHRPYRATTSATTSSHSSSEVTSRCTYSGQRSVDPVQSARSNGANGIG
jgi:hypothetical protein